MTAVPLVEEDLQGPEFNDIQLKSSDGELIPCSRFALCKHSPVFSYLLADTSKAVFTVQLSTALLREVRHVCHFGTTSFHTKPTNESTMRTLCKLLVAMDHYKMDDSLCKKVYDEIRRATRHGFALVVVDEFGLEYTTESRYWIMLSANTARLSLNVRPYKSLLPDETSGLGGVRSIRDKNKMKQIVSELEDEPAWLKFEALYVWAKARESNRVAAAKLWKKTNMLKRLQAEDPAFFSATSQTNCYKADSFATSKAFAALYEHAKVKNMANQKASVLFRCQLILYFSLLIPFGIILFSIGRVDPSLWNLARFVARYSVGFRLFLPHVKDRLLLSPIANW